KLLKVIEVVLDKYIRWSISSKSIITISRTNTRATNFKQNSRINTHV
ncbi:24177_t:CDS:2, partial [Gigaspora rosea]